MIFPIKKNDLLPVLAVQLLENGKPISLVGATVRFIMRAPGSGTQKIAAPAVVTNAGQGEVAYVWTGTDTDTAGKFKAEWEILDSGKPRTVPSREYDYIDIWDDLG